MYKLVSLKLKNNYAKNQEKTELLSCNSDIIKVGYIKQGNIMKIRKIRLINFKRFTDYTIEPNEQINILVGDNEAGKSSILEAIDLVSGGNTRRIEAIGLDRLLNIDAVKKFNAGERTFENLPQLRIELYIQGNYDFRMNGNNNLDGIECDGIKLVCEPNQDCTADIAYILSDSLDAFPYDFYSIRFSTFADERYSGYKKRFRSTLIDSSCMNSEYTTNAFVHDMYIQYTENNIKERAHHRNSYRQMRMNFQNNNLTSLNNLLQSEKHYTFGLKSGAAIALESDLMIYENEIGIDRKGMGKQTLIKTDFALGRAGDGSDAILIEEPENHLSPVNLRKLIQTITDTNQCQLFITTHNSLISSRLELKNLLIIHSNQDNHPIMLKDLSPETGKYFMKAPAANIIEFTLANKVILVEGPAEFMLMENFYESCVGCKPEKDGVNIINIRGLSFKRYLDISKLTNSKAAVITDNDKNHQKHCIDKYQEYANKENIKIFYESDEKKYTFEVVLYEDNKALCDRLFGDSAQEYMLNNKTEAAYALLSESSEILVPEYIKRAIEWIRK
ncbi:ATP-dependent nuclease [Candidatus Avelusimicrobium fimicolum]|uniref:ATP-dependent nuclease n=1 Tax=Candidatus Avelusimicrobium fimicolum TaxID=3416216 RepID=UPI003D1014D5